MATPYNPATVNYLNQNWTTSDPRKISANQLQTNAQAAQAAQQNATQAQDYLTPIEQQMASGQGGYSPDELSQIRMTPEQQQQMVTSAGISAGTQTAAATDAAQRAANASGGNPLALAAYRARAAQQEGAQAGDAMTQARVAASNAAAQRAENIGQTRIGQQNVGLGLQSQYQQQQNQDVQNALNRQTTGAGQGIQASQTPSTFDKIMGGIGGFLGALDEGYAADGGGGMRDAVVAEGGPEAVVPLRANYMQDGGSSTEGLGPSTAQQGYEVTKESPDPILDRLREINRPPSARWPAQDVGGQFSFSNRTEDIPGQFLPSNAATMTTKEHTKWQSDRDKIPGSKEADKKAVEKTKRYLQDGDGAFDFGGDYSSDASGGTGSTGSTGTAATSTPWFQRLKAAISPQPPTSNAPGAPAHTAGTPSDNPPSMQSARTLGGGIGTLAKMFLAEDGGNYLSDGWSGEESGKWGGSSTGDIDSVSRFLADGVMGAADGAIFTKPTQVKMGPNDAAVPLSYRARAKTRPSMAMPVVNQIQQRRMYGG
jgi:hypothetical protein